MSKRVLRTKSMRVSVSAWRENNEYEIVDSISITADVQVVTNTPKALNTRAEGSAQRTLGK